MGRSGAGGEAKVLILKLCGPQCPFQHIEGLFISLTYKRLPWFIGRESSKKSLLYLPSLFCRNQVVRGGETTCWVWGTSHMVLTGAKLTLWWGGRSVPWRWNCFAHCLQEIKKKKGIKEEVQLTSKQKEMLQAQLDKEAQIRRRLQEVSGCCHRTSVRECAGQPRPAPGCPRARPR